MCVGGVWVWVYVCVGGRGGGGRHRIIYYPEILQNTPLPSISLYIYTLYPLRRHHLPSTLCDIRSIPLYGCALYGYALCPLPYTAIPSTLYPVKKKTCQNSSRDQSCEPCFKVNHALRRYKGTPTALTPTTRENVKKFLKGNPEAQERYCEMMIDIKKQHEAGERVVTAPVVHELCRIAGSQEQTVLGVARVDLYPVPTQDLQKLVGEFPHISKYFEGKPTILSVYRGGFGTKAVKVKAQLVRATVNMEHYESVSRFGKLTEQKRNIFDDKLPAPDDCDDDLPHHEHIRDSGEKRQQNNNQGSGEYRPQNDNDEPRDNKRYMVEPEIMRNPADQPSAKRQKNGYDEDGKIMEISEYPPKMEIADHGALVHKIENSGRGTSAAAASAKSDSIRGLHDINCDIVSLLSQQSLSTQTNLAAMAGIVSTGKMAIEKAKKSSEYENGDAYEFVVEVENALSVVSDLESILSSPANANLPVHCDMCTKFDSAVYRWVRCDPHERELLTNDFMRAYPWIPFMAGQLLKNLINAKANAKMYRMTPGLCEFGTGRSWDYASLGALELLVCSHKSDAVCGLLLIHPIVLSGAHRAGLCQQVGSKILHGRLIATSKEAKTTAHTFVGKWLEGVKMVENGHDNTLGLVAAVQTGIKKTLEDMKLVLAANAVAGQLLKKKNEPGSEKTENVDNNFERVLDVVKKGREQPEWGLVYKALDTRDIKKASEEQTRVTAKMARKRAMLAEIDNATRAVSNGAEISTGKILDFFSFIDQAADVCMVDDPSFKVDEDFEKTMSAACSAITDCKKEKWECSFEKQGFLITLETTSSRIEAKLNPKKPDQGDTQNDNTKTPAVGTEAPDTEPGRTGPNGKDEADAETQNEGETKGGKKNPQKKENGKPESKPKPKVVQKPKEEKTTIANAILATIKNCADTLITQVKQLTTVDYMAIVTKFNEELGEGLRKLTEGNYEFAQKMLKEKTQDGEATAYGSWIKYIEPSKNIKTQQMWVFINTLMDAISLEEFIQNKKLERVLPLACRYKSRHAWNKLLHEPGQNLEYVGTLKGIMDRNLAKVETLAVDSFVGVSEKIAPYWRSIPGDNFQEKVKYAWQDKGALKKAMIYPDWFDTRLIPVKHLVFDNWTFSHANQSLIQHTWIKNQICCVEDLLIYVLINHPFLLPGYEGPEQDCGERNELVMQVLKKFPASAERTTIIDIAFTMVQYEEDNYDE